MTFFVKKAIGLETASQRPGHSSPGVISCKHIFEIAKVKQEDRPDISLQSWCKSIVGTCKSMGIRVVRTPEEVEA